MLANPPESSGPTPPWAAASPKTSSGSSMPSSPPTSRTPSQQRSGFSHRWSPWLLQPSQQGLNVAFARALLGQSGQRRECKRRMLLRYFRQRALLAVQETHGSTDDHILLAHSTQHPR
eukprot:5533084-Pyramimonas_sp.AAC.1